MLAISTSFPSPLEGEGRVGGRAFHQPIEHIARARLGAAARRRSPAAAARRMDLDRVARPDDDARLLGLERARRPALGAQHIVVRQPVLAAEEAAGAVAHAVAGGVAKRRLRGLHHDLEIDSGTAAVLPVAARARAELVFAEE